MNPEKVGKFISKMRKRKGLTQSQLAEIINVSDKTISKWENGNRMPDLSILKSLSDTLNITVSELLDGEESMIKNEKDDISYNGIKYYTQQNDKRNTKKYISIIFVILLFSTIAIFSVFFFLNNYNNCHIYSLSSFKKDFSLDGVIVNTPEKQIISINSLKNAEAYDLDFVELYAYEYRLYYDSELIYGKGDIANVVIDKYSQPQYLNDVLDSINLYLTGDTNYLNINFNNIMNKELILEISYININKKEEILKLPIKIEKIFSNNKFAYDGGEKF